MDVAKLYIAYNSTTLRSWTYNGVFGGNLAAIGVALIVSSLLDFGNLHCLMLGYLGSGGGPSSRALICRPLVAIGP